MTKAEKSLRWVVNQIPDFKPTTNEEKMLVAIKLYSEAGAEEIKRLEAENASLREKLERAVELPYKRKRLLWGDKDKETLLCPDCLTDLMGGIGDETFVVQCPNCGCFVDCMVEPIPFTEAAEARLAELKGEKEEMTNADRQRNLDRSEEPKGTRIYCDHCGYRYNVKKRDKWEQECFARASDMIRNPCAMAYNRMKRTDI
jgi:hypothetical protein